MYIYDNNNLIMEIPNVIVSIWGCGPVYRDRIKFTIQKAIDTGYPHILPYIVLTDLPSDFDEFRSKTDKIIDVIDIHAEREKYSPWSKEFEYICQERYDEQKYGEEFVTALKIGKVFSYATHRFAFPRIAELGYTRFLHSDADVDIRYDKIVNGKLSEEEFWGQFNTPINSMKGLDLEEKELDNGGSTYFNISVIVGNILRYEIRRLHPEYENLCCLQITHKQTECGFRYYNLESTSLILKYFELWDEITKIMLNNKYLVQAIGGPGYIRIDNIMHTVITDALNIQKLNFEKEYHHVNLYNADRHFYPRILSSYINGVEIVLQAAKTRAEFLKINKELIEIQKSRDEIF